jgi:hypothetical protein
MTYLAQDLLLLAAIVGFIIFFVRKLVRRQSSRVATKARSISDGGVPNGQWSQGFSSMGVFEGQTFGLCETGVSRSPHLHVRTIFLAANDLAPRFSAERASRLEGLRPFREVVESPDFQGIRLMTDEPDVLREGLHREFGNALHRVIDANISWIICMAASDHRRTLVQFGRYTGPESDILILNRTWSSDREPEPDAKHDLELLTALAKEMRGLSFSAARAPIPALPRLLLSGAWHTLLLFFIVLGGLIVFFFILWEIAAHM